MAEIATDITRLLNEARDGREGALDEVMALVYNRLRELARRQLRRRSADERAALQPTELVHEAFLRVIKQRVRYDSRGHFFAIATQAMLRVLLDQHRAQRRIKRGGGQVRVTLAGLASPAGSDTSVLVPAFVQALEELEQVDARSAEVTKLRVLWGLSLPEIAETMSLSQRTAEREWQFARAWLQSQLELPGESLSEPDENR